MIRKYADSDIDMDMKIREVNKNKKQFISL